MAQDSCEKLRNLGARSVLDRVDVRELSVYAREAGAEAVEAVVDELVGSHRYVQASAVVLGAGLVGVRVEPRHLVELVPTLENIDQISLLVRSVGGDAVAALMQVWQSGRLSHEREALVAWLVVRLSESVPAEVVAMLRTLSRHRLGLEASVIVGDAIRRVEDPELHKIGRAHVQAAELIRFERLERQFEQPILELLPERAPQQIVQGRTVESCGERVGRNDLCPCGSGKKHKKCCLHKPAVVRPATRAVLTTAQVQSLRPHEIAALDLSAQPSLHLRIMFNRLALFSEYDLALRVLTVMETRADIANADDYRADLIQKAVSDGRLDLARNLAREEDHEVIEELTTEFTLQEVRDTLAPVEQQARKALAEGGDGGIELAYSMLRHYPAWGILVARGAMSARRILDSEMLAEVIEEARDRLGLPAGDPAQQLLDFWADRHLEERAAALATRVRDASQAKLADEARVLREDFARVRRERDALEEQLREQQARLDAAERAQKEASTAHMQAPKASAPAPSSPVSSPPESVEGLEEVRRLRRKVDELKGIISNKNEESRHLRKQVSALEHGRHDSPPAPHTAHAPDPFDTLDAPTFEPTSRALLVPEYSERFRASLEHVPADIAARALHAATTLATRSTADWTDVKHMQAADVLAQRIGIHWRMIFRLAPDRAALEVLELVSRGDVERALKRYRQRSLPSTVP